MLQVTILGCGSSGGVPRPGSGWGACDPANPKNRRRRCSLLVERLASGERTSVLVDTSPDLREQLIDADVQHLDAVLFTHDHADHTHGIDDLRPLVLHQRRIVPCYATSITQSSLRERFGYIFEQPEGSGYPPIATLHPLVVGHNLTVDGPGGSVVAQPFSMEHGQGYEALGFRFGDLAYASDVSALDAKAMSMLSDLDVLIIDALRYTQHPTHFSLKEALAVIETVKPRRAILTNLHTDLDYNKLISEIPPFVTPAFDGMVMSVSCK